MNNFEKPISVDSKQKLRTTDQSLRDKVNKLLNIFCTDFKVSGKENLEEYQEKNPDEKFIIASSHISNLDAPAAIEALGDRLDIQITTESVIHGATPQEILFRLAGKENFAKLEYKKTKEGKHGVFNPEDFEKLAENLADGKSPWIAIHPFTVDEELQRSRIGSVYLAHKTGAKIIPTALEYHGGSISMEGLVNIAKAVTKKGPAIYHVGQVMELEPVDVSIIETVLKKREAGERVGKEEFQQFKEVHAKLKEQADQVAQVIANLLPEEQRGEYGEYKV